VLEKEFGKVEGVVRAKRKPYIPVVLSRAEVDRARVTPISDSVIGGMLTSKCAIAQANRIFILKDSLFAFSYPRKLNLI
jgi:hypothetical protein